MAQQHPPAKERAAEPCEASPLSPKTLSWTEILNRLLELDERLRRLEEAQL